MADNVPKEFRPKEGERRGDNNTGVRSRRGSASQLGWQEVQWRKDYHDSQQQGAVRSSSSLEQIQKPQELSDKTLQPREVATIKLEKLFGISEQDARNKLKELLSYLPDKASQQDVTESFE